MQVRVLGPTQVVGETGTIPLGTPKQRALLAALALHAGRTVSTDLLVETIWGEDAPPAVLSTLQAYVSGLRRCLEPDRPRGTAPTMLVTAGQGYALRLGPDDLDASQFARVVLAEHRRLTPYAGLVPAAPSESAGRPRPQAVMAEFEQAAAALDDALALWRGAAYAELGDSDDAHAERARLAELHLIAEEDRAVADLGLGQHALAAAQLEALTALHPLRERLWGLRALALARGGRQAEALTVLAELRTHLGDELGLEPSAELRALQTAILRQEVTPTRVPGGATTPTSPNPASPSPMPGAERRAVPDRAPMVGRDQQLHLLTDRLAGVSGGRPVFVSVVAEPGMGKTRLAEALMDWAEARRIRVVTGRGSQDEGAPPLWMWASVMRGLGRELPDPGVRASEFALWQDLADAVLTAAAEQPLLVVLDDLHWADPASLRALRLLVESTDPAQLMVLLTWRPHPPPRPALADVVEMLARRSAVRLALEGLSATDAGTLIAAVTGDHAADGDSVALRDRTDGNPFFLSEYARLAAERGLGELLAEPDPPTAVHDVLVRRLGRLPEATQGVVRAAAVIGRHFELPVLVVASGIGEDAALDGLEPALAAGLVREDGIDRFVFAHALVRDTAYAVQPMSRRARLHARVAEAMEGRPGREHEVARHWSAAGPAHAGRAWRAAVAAAEVASRAHAYEQAAELLESSLSQQENDPNLDPRDRYDVLLLLVDAYRWAGQWRLLVDAVQTAIQLARELGDVELVARAATGTTMGALWQSGAYGQVQTCVVGALRESLERLPTTDHPVRARVMLSLAGELYYGATFAEREALVDEALAMARRLGDDHLLLAGLLLACSALWRRSTAERRLQYAGEAEELAHLLAAQQELVLAVTFRAVVEAELGRVQAMWVSIERARLEAARLQLPYTLIVLDSLALGWLAMAGRFAEADDLLARIARLGDQVSLHVSNYAVESAMLVVRLWRGGADPVGAQLAAIAGGTLPADATVTSFLLRAGQTDEAEAHYRAHPISLASDDWLSVLTWCCASEVALAFGDAGLAAGAYARLAPYAGQACLAGTSNAMGPIDAFLALAALAVGELTAAAEHADRALELMALWQLPLAAQWLRDQRAAYEF